jgi:ribokinase
MKIINFGSLGNDYVYDVDHFVQAGETLSAKVLERYPGGKGLNQSVALAKAGCEVMHVGLVGQDGLHLKEGLRELGVDVSLVKEIDGPSGHAIIQRNQQGENSIIIHGGANHEFDQPLVEQALTKAEPGDVVLLQNETNGIVQILEQAKARQLPTVFNIAPCNDKVNQLPLDLVDLFIINETEGQTLTNQTEPEAIFKVLMERFSQAAFVLTLGEQGAKYLDQRQRITVPAEHVDVVDTTAAGDTFTGYFLAHWLKGNPIESCLKIASCAAAICITKKGASVSIPSPSELIL